MRDRSKRPNYVPETFFLVHWSNYDRRVETPILAILANFGRKIRKSQPQNRGSDPSKFGQNRNFLEKILRVTGQKKSAFRAIWGQINRFVTLDFAKMPQKCLIWHPVFSIQNEVQK